ncbi:16S rRNA (cytidine1402-2'-O)-methyltransferase [Lipingzhangella halophila]|uniref:16S rRNA (Cytidine1402-2'-O)-methyltransferase n=1 Tax=Lipingzhangella halophila TaxID=1783352 RepID=A0A7W7W0J6_9ACTN|nr:16S rRNA (cytidine(1402)-2'-O)-methyltransferase [Lipingzhangella halophila]MBB4929701.1 16S rRNA (cytidine1402-2'-O)-methyltransferase [Lipingzhangella halophila]
MTVAGAADPGTLTLAGLPIGHRDDTPPRLVAALQATGIIAAEDTRRVRQFASRLGIRLGGEGGARVVSYYDANESRRTEELMADLRAGRDVLMVTDAGMPGVSDPGYRLVTACVEAGVPVTAIPGPSAVTTALVLSGLPTDRFCFEGFPPRKGQAGRFRELAGERRTMVFFESPRRLAATLEAMAEAFGAQRRAAACRELTKTYEEVRRAPLADLAEWAREGVRGEVTLVVAGAERGAARPSTAELASTVAEREATGVPRKQAIQELARELGIPKREVYDAVHR